MPKERHDPKENRLLGALPREAYERLQPHLESISLEAKQVIYEPGKPIEHVYFPRNAVVSLLTAMETGESIEVGTVGNEGMLGVPLFLGFQTNPGRAEGQIPGEALRMQAEVFSQEMQSLGPLHDLLHRYTYAMVMQISQSAACNRLHSLEERLCRWLLMTHDRVGADQFLLTQEFMAQMLGVRRPTVNTAASILQKAGLIQYSRGKITILNRSGLEASS